MFKKVCKNAIEMSNIVGIIGILYTVVTLNRYTFYT